MIRIEEFPKNGAPWRIDGLGRIHYPSSSNSEPSIATHLSELKPDYFDPLSNGALTGNGRTVHVKLGQIALLKHGSVWVDGVRSLPRMEPHWHEFTLDPAQLSLHRFDEAIPLDGRQIVPLAPSRFKVSRDSWNGLADSWLGVIEPSDARAAFFVFPCATLFQKCAATSPTAVRRLAWGQLDRIVDNAGWIDDEDKTYYVELFQKIRDAEAQVHANLCADPVGAREYARFRAALVANSVNAVAGATKRFTTHVKFGMPFSNELEVRVQGKNLRVDNPDGEPIWGFLVTEIVALRPKLIFDRLIIQRKNDGRQAKNADDDELEDAWIGTEQFPVNLDAEAELLVNSGDDPLASLAALCIEEAGGFEAIDLEILKVPKDSQQYGGRRCGGVKSEFDGTTTTGDLRHGDEGAAELDIEAHEAPRVPITLEDFFETLQILRSAEISIGTVPVTDRHRFNDTGDVVNFFPHKMEGLRSWNRISSEPDAPARAFVVAVCNAGGVWHHFLELERKGMEAHALAYIRVSDGSQISPRAMCAFIYDVARNNGWDDEAVQPQWIFERINHSPKFGNARFASVLAARLGVRLPSQSKVAQPSQDATPQPVGTRPTDPVVEVPALAHHSSKP